MTSPGQRERDKLLLSVFRMPVPPTIVSRKSSITNAYVSAIIPVIPPTPDEIEEALSILGMDVSTVCCSYCGKQHTEWDHLRPLVVKRQPTGYISEIANLVPSCNKCNGSKRNENWRVWMLSTKGQHSPTVRKIADIEQRMIRLEAFEKWRVPTKVEFEIILGVKKWKEYWDLWKQINREMEKCHALATTLRDKVVGSLLKPRETQRKQVRHRKNSAV